MTETPKRYNVNTGFCFKAIYNEQCGMLHNFSTVIRKIRTNSGVLFTFTCPDVYIFCRCLAKPCMYCSEVLIVVF